jgi:acetyl esterase
LAGFVSLNGLRSLPVDAARRVNDSEAAVMFGPVESVANVTERRIPGPGGQIRLRIYRPASTGSLPILVYFHGGGWVVGSLDSHDGVARFLAKPRALPGGFG